LSGTFYRLKYGRNKHRRRPSLNALVEPDPHNTYEQFENLKASYFDDAEKYYSTLNCNQSSSDKEIKTNYKKFVKDFHPATIVSKGLPEE